MGILESALRDADFVLGSRHLHTITVRATLAGCRAVLGRGPDAVAGLERAVADCTELLRTIPTPAPSPKGPSPKGPSPKGLGLTA